MFNCNTDIEKQLFLFKPAYIRFHLNRVYVDNNFVSEACPNLNVGVPFYFVKTNQMIMEPQSKCVLCCVSVVVTIV
jgi:hypothetical protein